MYFARVFTLSCLALVLLAGLSSQNLFAANSTVGPCAGPGFHYGTISAAVSAPSAGPTISVCPGIYPEQVSITTSLTLKGVPNGTNDAPVIVPPSGGLVQNGSEISGFPVAAQIFVSTNGGTVSIKGITVDGTGNNVSTCGLDIDGIYYYNTAGTISDNVVRNQYATNFGVFGGCQQGLAINVESPNPNTITISNNSVRAYQKNGITVTGAAATGTATVNGGQNPVPTGGPNATITGNYVVGLGATGMNWPTCPDYQMCAGTPPEVNGGAAENGIQVGFGAAGAIVSNIVNDNIWWGEYAEYDYDGNMGATDYNAASGILVFASSGITVTANEVGSAQYGIAIETDGSGYCGPVVNGVTTLSCGLANDAVLESNKVVGTQVYDGVDLCSSGNVAKTNGVYGSTESAFHVDDSCTNSNLGTTSGDNNLVGSNTINEGCAGILTGTGTTGNNFGSPGGSPGPNTFFNVTNTLLAGDTCTSPALVVGKISREHPSLRPSPYAPRRVK